MMKRILLFLFFIFTALSTQAGLFDKKPAFLPVDEAFQFSAAKSENQENVIVMPHLGASTPESEDNCARMAVKEIKDYLESGNIVNSVNFPYINEPRTTKYRICLIHKNIPNMLAQFATLLANREINIENMVNKAKGEYAYTIIETNDVVDMNDFEALENVIKVRVIE